MSSAHSINQPGPITIRRNQRRVYTDDELISRLENQDGVIRTSRLVKGSLEIVEKQPTRSIWSMSSWQDGWFEVQDMGSQMVVAAALEGLNELDRDLQQSSNLTIVDYCAGNGGKTLAMISSLSSDAFDKASIGIVAHDVDMNRLKQLRGSLPRAGHPFSNVNVSITTELQNVPQLRPTGASNYDGNGGVSGGADLILVDAPCSSSGVIRRHASLRYNLILQAELQLEILRNASQLVKKSGILVYATCSIFHEENEDVVAMFESQPEFDNVWEPFDFDEQEKEGFWKNMSSKSSVLPDASHLRVVLPRGKSDNDNSNRHDELNSDGFFMARWKRK